MVKVNCPRCACLYMQKTVLRSNTKSIARIGLKKEPCPECGLKDITSLEFKGLKAAKAQWKKQTGAKRVIWTNITIVEDEDLNEEITKIARG